MPKPVLPSKPAATSPGVWQATVEASLRRVASGVVQTIEYVNGVFERRNQVSDGASSQAIVVLDEQARRQLRQELAAEIAHGAPDADLDALRVFVDLLDASLDEEHLS